MSTPICLDICKNAPRSVCPRSCFVAPGARRRRRAARFADRGRAVEGGARERGLTSGRQAQSWSVDHFIRENVKQWRNRHAKRVGSLAVDREMKACRQLDREI